MTPELAVSGDLDRLRPERAAAQLDLLVELGITDIVDTRSEASDETYVRRRHPQIRYHHVPADDDGADRDDWWFETGVGAALEALAEPGRRVLVHCHMGVNRGPSMAFAVLLALGHEPVAALNAIREARPIAAIEYAPDALRWWHRRNRTETHVAADECARVLAWGGWDELDAAWVVSRIGWS